MLLLDHIVIEGVRQEIRFALSFRVDSKSICGCSVVVYFAYHPVAGQIAGVQNHLNYTI